MPETSREDRQVDERQRTICAIALFANDYSWEEIAAALGVTHDEATKLAADGADEQAAGTMGRMHSRGNPCRS